MGRSIVVQVFGPKPAYWTGLDRPSDVLFALTTKNLLEESFLDVTEMKLFGHSDRRYVWRRKGEALQL